MGYLYKKLKLLLYFFIPNSLLARFILIICIPTVLSLLFSVHIFLDRHWYNVSKQNSNFVAKQISFVVNLANNNKLSKLKHYNEFLPFSLEIKQLDKDISIKKKGRRRELRILDRALAKTINFSSISLLDSQISKIYTYIFLKDKILKITLDSTPIVSPTTNIFLIWIFSISLILMTISLIFARNQIRSILELANVAESLGRGLSKPRDYKPSGALEIRQTGMAVIKMSERIQKNTNKRAQMLAMISHDLRTPLTRMLLQLELLDETYEHKKLKDDAESMKHMIESYLDFARGEEAEEILEVDIIQWLISYIENDYHPTLKSNIKYENKGQFFVNIKPLSFKRAISNIVTNSEKYAEFSVLSTDSNDKFFEIILEDNGDGISEDQVDKVFSAFYRIDTARKIDSKGSVGLGLSITKEIVKNHKGDIKLERSKKFGGLKVVISLPLNNIISS